MKNTEDGDGEIVTVTEKGQATIPKRLREKHGIPAPGRVKFVENDAGVGVVRPVGTMREFRGLARTSEEQRPATAVLRVARERDRQESDDLLDRYADSESGSR
jgi:AbrB family looped-hinge helix DNA binding protein